MSTRLRLEGCPAPACDDLLFAAPVTTSYKLGYSFSFWKSAALRKREHVRACQSQLAGVTGLDALSVPVISRFLKRIESL